MLIRPATLAAAYLLPSSAQSPARQKQAILLLTISAAVFRSETAILLATTFLHLLITGRTTLTLIIRAGIACGLTALTLSVPVDSYFWQRIPLWPELAGFYYNAVLGSSSNWGTSPFHYYFTSALPRLLLNPVCIPLIAFALFQPGISSRARDLVIPNLAFVAIYSLQPHKEARFIFYVIPSLSAAAALGASFVVTRRSKSPFYALATSGLVLSVLASFAISCGMLLLSSLNYPGGDALSQLYTLTRGVTAPSQRLDVHADVLTCMTGLTLFGQNPSGIPLAFGQPPAEVLKSISTPWLVFDKTEDDKELIRPHFWQQFDYILAEDPAKIQGGHWKTIGVVHGYDGIEILKPGVTPPTHKHKSLGRGAIIHQIRDTARKYTRGWWVGPRMSPRIHIVKKIVDYEPKDKTT